MYYPLLSCICNVDLLNHIKIFLIYFYVHIIIKKERRLPENPSTLQYNVTECQKINLIFT
jgi:hypothetical protein